MSLVNFINKFCPNGVSHSHETGNNNKNTCLLCQDNQERKNFKKYCKKHFIEKKHTPNNNQIIILNKLFSDEKYFVPLEIQEKIFEYLNYTEKILIPIVLNEPGIMHLMSCRLCSNDFIEFLDKESCGHHKLPRKIYHYIKI